MTNESEVSQEAWAKVERVRFTDDNYIQDVGFVQIAHLLTLSALPDPAYRTYALIRGLAQQKGRIWWNTDRLAILRGVHRVTLSKHLSELCKFGLIERRRRVGTSSDTHFKRLEDIFPEIAAQTVAAMLWGGIESDDDLSALVKRLADLTSPSAEAELDAAFGPRDHELVPLERGSSTLPWIARHNVNTERWRLWGVGCSSEGTQRNGISWESIQQVGQTIAEQAGVEPDWTKSKSVSWWVGKCADLYRLCGGDLDEISTVITRMRKHKPPLTIASPASLENMLRARMGELKVSEQSDDKSEGERKAEAVRALMRERGASDAMD